MEVAQVVASIISALGNSKDLFRRMVGKKPRKRGREATLSEEESWLKDSLDRRPHQIRRSYDNSVSRFGHRFKTGDTTAHTSLAHTLLVLNSGLLNLINHVLQRDSRHHTGSNKALYDLTETATLDTLSALSQLSIRLASNSSLDLRTLDPQPVPRRRKRSQKGASNVPIVRGAWVRPKASSVVSAATRQSHKKPSIVGKTTSEVVPPGPQATKNLKARRSYDKVVGTRTDNRVPSMLIVPSDLFLPLERPQQYKPDEHGSLGPAAMRQSDSSRRPRPPSAATYLTTSTKIGEIIPRRHDSVNSLIQQQVQDPRLVQYGAGSVIVDSGPKKIRRGFKFWKRNEEKAVPIAIH
jgi:hypothetical protein